MHQKQHYYRLCFLMSTSHFENSLSIHVLVVYTWWSEGGRMNVSDVAVQYWLSSFFQIFRHKPPIRIPIFQVFFAWNRILPEHARSRTKWFWFFFSQRSELTNGWRVWLVLGSRPYPCIVNQIGDGWLALQWRLFVKEPRDATRTWAFSLLTTTLPCNRYWYELSPLGTPE
jgi:hypothetical protein